MQKRKNLVLLGLAVLMVDLTLVYLGFPLEPLDARLFSTPQDIAAVFAKQGHAGRQLYGWLEYLDLTFILLYSTFFTHLLQALIGRDDWKPGSGDGTGPGSRGKRPGLASFTPIYLAAAFDLVETGGILVLLAQYPEQNVWLARIVGISTLLKWSSMAWFIGILVRRAWIVLRSKMALRSNRNARSVAVEPDATHPASG